MAKNYKFEVRFSESTYNKIIKISEKQKITKSEVVRKIVEDYTHPTNEKILKEVKKVKKTTDNIENMIHGDAFIGKGKK